MYFAHFVLPLLAATCAVAMPQAYQLPADAETILSSVPISESFSCEGQPYGYYADTDNNCEIFHICLPVENDVGEVNG